MGKQPMANEGGTSYNKTSNEKSLIYNTILSFFVDFQEMVIKNLNYCE